MSIVNTQGDGTGTIRWVHGDSNGDIIDAWHPALQADENLNDSDKTLTVAASTEWEILTIWVELTTTATAGARQLVLEFQDDSSDVIGQMRAGATQIESLTYYYMFGQAFGAELTSVRDSDFLYIPLPKIILPASYVIRVYDNNAVDAAADDMIIQALVNARSVP